MNACVDQAFVDDRVDHRVEQRDVGVGLELQVAVRVARQLGAARVGSTISFAPRFAAFFIQVAATGWFTVGLAPMTKITSACSTSLTWLLTAPEPTPSSSAATLEAWHSRVQWSTLLLPKPVRTSFWNR